MFQVSGLLSSTISKLETRNLIFVAVEGIEPTSLDYQSSALAVELHREVVDPTGLKPAPHGLKGRRSVTRAPGQQHFRFLIADCRLASARRKESIAGKDANWQSEIDNQQ